MSEKFKVGDKVYPVNMTKSNWCSIGYDECDGHMGAWGDIYDKLLEGGIIEEVEDDEVCINSWYIPMSIVTKLKKGEVVMSESAKWSFEALSFDGIDYQKIMSELSDKNPIAFMEVESEATGELERCVIVSGNMLKMADNKGVGIPFEHVHDHSEGYGGMLIILDDKAGYGQFVEWVREVKAAKWLNPAKSTVTVTLPKI